MNNQQTIQNGEVAINDTKKKFAIGDLFLLLLFFSAFMLISYITYAAFKQRLPEFDEWPMWFAPGLTFSIGILTCRDQLRAKLVEEATRNKVTNLNLIAMVLIFLACFALNMPMNPLYHVLIVLGLFSFFLLWDYLMIRWLANDDGCAQHRENIIVANRLINWPTFIGLLIILLIIWWHPLHVDGHPSVGVLDDIFGKSLDKAIRDQAIVKLISVESGLFVSGAIAFHLSVVAVAYFTATRIRRKGQVSK